MSLPSNRFEMRRARYKLLNPNAMCGKCRVFVELWETTNGRKVYFDLPAVVGSESEVAVAHRATCKGKPEPVFVNPALEAATFTEQERVRAATGLRDRTRARIVLALFDDGDFAYAVRLGIDPEDIRHELITAANRIRRQEEAHRG